MRTDEDSSRAIIDAALAREPDAIDDSIIGLLELLANSLIGMIGEQGFETLLYRSAQRVQTDFAWLQFDRFPRPVDPEFQQLRSSFDGQQPAQARAAGALLFSTLTDLLSTLIGRHMTLLILRSATEGVRRKISEGA